MDGKKKINVINYEPLYFEDVRVLASGNFYAPADAVISNLHVKTLPDGNQILFLEWMIKCISVLDRYSEIPNNLPSITQTLIHGNGKKVREDTQIGSFDKWWPTYKISFEVKVDSFGSQPGFLLLFTAKNGDCRFSCSSGQYIPAVFTRK